LCGKGFAKFAEKEMAVNAGQKTLALARPSNFRMRLARASDCRPERW